MPDILKDKLILIEDDQEVYETLFNLKSIDKEKIDERNNNEIDFTVEKKKDKKKRDIEVIRQDYQTTEDIMYRVLTILYQKHYLEINAGRALYDALWNWLIDITTKETKEEIINNLKETMEISGELINELSICLHNLISLSDKEQMDIEEAMESEEMTEEDYEKYIEEMLEEEETNEIDVDEYIEEIKKQMLEEELKEVEKEIHEIIKEIDLVQYIIEKEIQEIINEQTKIMTTNNENYEDMFPDFEDVFEEEQVESVSINDIFASN
ncbi:gelsolin-related protein of 125 kDa-like [Hydra vulgaris]|uniref:Gelsolin-related protein of 125 kDa-like n=1 Tax=Hydra vulgaris TaxID=6087 RepID=A0ABM4DMH2_HYDVU